LTCPARETLSATAVPPPEFSGSFDHSSHTFAMGNLVNNQEEEEEEEEDDDDNNNNNTNNLSLVLTMLEATYWPTQNYASRSFGDIAPCEARLKF
jgi:hypothetical protein